MDHLLADCPFSCTLWHELLSWVRSARLLSEKNSWTETGGTGTFTPLLCAVEWHLVAGYANGMVDLEEANAATTDNARPNATEMLDRIRAEACLWVQVGAMQLRSLLRWDLAFSLGMWCCNVWGVSLPWACTFLLYMHQDESFAFSRKKKSFYFLVFVTTDPNMIKQHIALATAILI